LIIADCSCLVGLVVWIVKSEGVLRSASGYGGIEHSVEDGFSLTTLSSNIFR
jgi:hypothetical protein